MRTKFWIAVAVVLALGSTAAVFAGETEQDIINRYTKKLEKKHVSTPAGWHLLLISIV